MGRLYNVMCRQNAWRPVLARLQLLSKLVPILGVQSGGGEGMPLEGLMKFVGSGFASANAEVRSAAVDLTVLVSLLCITQSNALFAAAFEAALGYVGKIALTHCIMFSVFWLYEVIYISNRSCKQMKGQQT